MHVIFICSYNCFTLREIENIEIYIFTYLYVQNRLNSICKNNYETKDLISSCVASLNESRFCASSHLNLTDDI